LTQEQDKRKWPRQDMALKIRLKAVPGETCEGEKCFYTRNVSTGGLFFESDTPPAFPEGAMVDVEINMPLARFGFTSSRRLETRGKVCRVEDRGKEHVGVAVEFVAPPRFVTP
jgi:hypothetical protein